MLFFVLFYRINYILSYLMTTSIEEAFASELLCTKWTVVSSPQPLTD